MRSGIVVAALLACIMPAAAQPAESFLEAPGPLGPLKGTLLQGASAGGPVVLIIPGSGPTDRDGNSPLGVKAATYKLLAEGLAAQGIGSLRIDKRGLFASAGAVSDANAVTVADYATDVKAWIAAIRAKTRASCVWALGHSEGALVALAAAQDAKDVCGLVLVSGAGQPMGEVLRQQLKANPANAPLLEQAMPAIDALEAGKHVDVGGMSPALLPLFRPQVQNYLIDAFSYDPRKLIAAHKGPVLIVEGAKDIQVSVEDARALKAAAPAAALVIVPDANHVLKAVAADSRAANVATYADPGLPLAPGVIDPIAKFIRQGQP
jgi:pimeloyl-ACP methyl ester carboxylesterase